jgi:helicase SWR1
VKTEPKSPSPAQDVENATDHNSDGPSAKRRKLAGPSKKEDPNPWNLPKAEGPTSFVEGGRRKSGRTNAIPLDLQPAKSKRQTRAAYDKDLGKHWKRTPKPINGSVKNNADTRRTVSSVIHPNRGPGRHPKHADVGSSRQIKMENGISKHSASKPVARSRYNRRESEPRVNGHRRTFSGVSNGIENVQQNNGDVTSEGSDEEADDSVSTSSAVGRSASPPSTLQKIRFKVRMPKPSIQTPANIPPPRKFSSFEDFLDHDVSEPFVGPAIINPTQVSREAVLRHKVKQAQVAGSKFSEALTRPLKQQEPKLYSHHDHLMAHMRDFHHRLDLERKEHKRQAKQRALDVAAHKKQQELASRVKTVEELEQEQVELSKQQYRALVKDVARLWAAVEIEVDLLRRGEWEEEQQARRKRQLEAVLEKSQALLVRHDTSDVEGDVEDAEDGDTDDSSESEEDDDMISDSGSDSSENDDENIDQDANLSPEALRKRYANLPDLIQDPDDASENAGQASSPSPDAIEDEHDDTSDASTEMDSEMDSESDEDDSDEDEDASDGEDTAGAGLLGLFSKREIEDMKPEPEPGGEDSEELDETTKHAVVSPAESADDVNMVAHDPDVSETLSVAHREAETDDVEMVPEILNIDTPNEATSREESVRDSPHTTASHKTEVESASSLDHPVEHPLGPVTDEVTSTVKTPIPSLLRATLRPYQHEGLDWLADLYATGRSGILADEMGLGKTIQSIALLAHLAVEHEVWGPHLIVVPTSVILNWEMEFKKFCPGFKVLTYYGNQDERKQKRKGWMQQDAFNVCITSYQLVLQDVNSFKRRQWHYMILDEAHNIKNFRSDRWQTMMTFNTHSRLLLTGTPLQNNLTELWSLLFFLRSGSNTGEDDDGFAGLEQFSEWFKNPVSSILNHGREVMTEDDKKQVEKLHKVIRPFLLRRLKRDVEKQMPLKYEHVELCRLSKRQRQLYDGFMSRAQTKETLASGNYLTIINALMQLRKVCNHPDLFETRPITTSFAMQKSVASSFEIENLLVRRRLLQDEDDKLNLDFLNFAPISREHMSMIEFRDTRKLIPMVPLEELRSTQWQRLRNEQLFEGQSMANVLASLENIGRDLRFKEMGNMLNIDSYRHFGGPLRGRRLLQQLKINSNYERLSRHPGTKIMTKLWESEEPLQSISLVQSIETRAARMKPLVEKFGCITPAVVANDLSSTVLTETGTSLIRQEQAQWPSDPFHEARMKLSIAFPDKRLLQYDCGKLQRLDKLLRTLQAGGHRALIFTQMTKVLDILEQFLNIHGHRYLRLDGATKIEQRQVLTDRFNNDTRILAFILSSRSGGLGINLTGADTVIFYDLDWNPAMDKQCTDRAHRIGQTRDVHIYRFVSEHTIESNILRKATQKQMLDDVVIQEGDFTTDYLSKIGYRDMLPDQETDEVGAAMDRVLGNDRNAAEVLETAEDVEDATAAKVAAKEVTNADDGDFDDKIATPAEPTGPYDATKAGTAVASKTAAAEDDQLGVDEYMLRLRQYLLKDVPLAPPKDKSKKRKRKGEEHRVRKPR